MTDVADRDPTDHEASDREAIEAVKSRALDLLARREHGVKELETKLAQRLDHDAETIRRAIGELAGKDLVSDERFAEAYARDAVRLKPKAERRIVAELVERRVPAAIASRAVSRVFADEEVDDADLARRLAETYLPRVEGRATEVAWRRLGRYLTGRGFSATLAYDLCEELLPESDPTGGGG